MVQVNLAWTVTQGQAQSVDLPLALALISLESLLLRNQLSKALKISEATRESPILMHLVEQVANSLFSLLSHSDFSDNFTQVLLERAPQRFALLQGATTSTTSTQKHSVP